ncbi:hypothetical protein LOAG_16876 [Loa loa]|uniref:Fibrous sheath-interacting protein 1 n=1 Tax=Loa loa TaxID=7209 RepID=A0A1I7VVW1_LOALO|nr:hypothetical protein LOAG_16876 [Loa loa]EJD76100.1 hypothetical protein LOAG_16876 [Loa loa]
MSKQEADIREKKRSDLVDIIGLLRLRLMDAVQDEVNSCGETVAKIMDGILPEDEGSLAAAPYDNLMEDDTESVSDQLGDCDYAIDPVTASAIKQCEEVLEETAWESCRKGSQEIPKEPELSNEEPEHSKEATGEENVESVIQKLFMEAAKVVIKLLENEETDESTACDH